MKLMHAFAISANLLGFGFVIAPAMAQTTRTWVSGAGNDANPCSRTSPCQTFAGAISKTAIGGEINVLDAGGYGTLVINHAITIRADHVEAGVLASGTNGITVAAGAQDNVVLDGLDIEGHGTGLDGIAIQSAGEVSIKNSNIHQFTGNGVTIVTNSLVRVIIRNSTISENGDSGVVVNSVSGCGHVRIMDSMILGNTNDGIQVNGSGNEAMIFNVEVFGNHRQLNVRTGVTGSAIYSFGNNMIPDSFGDNPASLSLK